MLKKWLIRSLAALGILLLVGIAGFLVWAMNPQGPSEEALAALQSDGRVKVEQATDWILFRPTGASISTGFIFYPGGRVEYRSYAPHLKEIAALGYPVVLVPMPLNFAFLAPDIAAEVIAAYPQIENWVVGGHSLGGAMAAGFAGRNLDTVAGLVLWAAYPGENIAGIDLPVLSVFGTEDGLATVEKIESSRTSLPSDTIYIPVQGGNHARFGSYGEQAGDNPASISRAEQRRQVVNATVSFLSSIGEN